MSLVVQKYGGSSLTNADSIKRVARRIVETRKAGHEVCVVVSAMGDTTDELVNLAQQVTPLPPGREMDMLLTAGERISMALLAMAIANLGHTARSFTGSQAGVITDSSHGRARIIDVTPGRIRGALDDGDVAIVAGFQGATADAEMLRHSRWLTSHYGKPRAKDSVRIDAKLLLTQQRAFQDSRDSLGLQLSDMLAAILRRALNDRLQFPGWKDFGGLLVRHWQAGDGFVQLGSGSDIPMLGHARKVCQVLHPRAKNMLVERNRNAGTPRT